MTHAVNDEALDIDASVRLFNAIDERTTPQSYSAQVEHEVRTRV